MKQAIVFIQKNWLPLLAVLGAIMLWSKMRNIFSSLFGWMAPGQSVKQATTGAAAAIMQPTSLPSIFFNPVGSAITLAAKAKKASTAAVQKKKEETAAAYNNGTQSRTERANKLKKEFLEKRYLRFKLLETVNAEIVKFDAFGAVVMVGKQKRLPKGMVIERPMGFFSTITLKGNLVLSDIQANVQYAVNPHLLTLV